MEEINISCNSIECNSIEEANIIPSGVFSQESPDNHSNITLDHDGSSDAQTRRVRLKLTITPAFCNLAFITLARLRAEENDLIGTSKIMDNIAPQTAQLKCRASNFSVSSLTIGSWQIISQRQGDLMGKCYYAKKKIVWEILDGDRKRKLEMPFSYITAIKATINGNEPGELKIELNLPPDFAIEAPPQPRKHTVWIVNAPDFTGNQALFCRRHVVTCPRGALDKSYNMLLQSDSRLLELSQKLFPTDEYPMFSLYDAININTLHQCNCCGGSKLDPLEQYCYACTQGYFRQQPHSNAPPMPGFNPNSGKYIDPSVQNIYACSQGSFLQQPNGPSGLNAPPIPGLNSNGGNFIDPAIQNYYTCSQGYFPQQPHGTWGPNALSMPVMGFNPDGGKAEEYCLMGTSKFMDNVVSPITPEKYRASNFLISSLTIGNWQKFSQREGDLMAKCCYNKKKIVWEISDGDRKNKMEIPFSYIIAIKAILPDNEPGELKIELNVPPDFVIEAPSQSRKEDAPDFTKNQALLCRRHTVTCLPGALDKPYNMLLKSDNRLLELSQKPFPTDEYPIFSLVGAINLKMSSQCNRCGESKLDSSVENCYACSHGPPDWNVPPAPVTGYIPNGGNYNNGMTDLNEIENNQENIYFPQGRGVLSTSPSTVESSPHIFPYTNPIHSLPDQRLGSTQSELVGDISTEPDEELIRALQFPGEN